jgi:membrane protein DedA with SNARE-associated domain
MPWASFFSYNVAGAILWSITISLVGYFFGDHWDLLEKWIKGSGVFALVFIILIAFLRWLYLKKRGS